MPVATGAWQGPLPPAAAWQPKFVNPSAERRAAYAVDGKRLEIYVNLYAAQSQGRELIFHHNSVVPADRFTLIRRLPPRAQTPPAVVVADREGTRWVVAQSYEVGGWATASPPVAQLFYGLRAIVRPTPAGTLAVATRCEADCNSAERAVDEFWREHSGELMTLIPDR
jgi:EpsI family protein